ncbi:MAG: orotate phosphoribosyltransferase, partial [Spirochaetaceae bacterium]
ADAVLAIPPVLCYDPSEMAREEYLRRLQRQGLDDLIRFGQPEFTESWFPYTSGEVGPYYIQSIVVERDGAAYRRAVDALCELIRLEIGLDGFDAISGGESRDWDFSNPVAASLEKPHVKIYKNGRMLGARPAGRRVVHVADLNNQGSSIRDIWAPAVRSAGGELIHAFFFVDRLEDGVEVLEDIGVPAASVVPLDGEAWRYLRERGYIDEHMYRSLERRRLDKRGWAVEALRRHPDPLGRLLTSDDEADRAKGRRILEVGYPEHRGELLALLSRRGYAVDDRKGA